MIVWCIEEIYNRRDWFRRVQNCRPHPPSSGSVTPWTTTTSATNMTLMMLRLNETCCSCSRDRAIDDDSSPPTINTYIFVYGSLSLTTSSCRNKKLLLSALQQHFGADLLLQQFLSGDESSSLDLAITMSAAFSKLCSWKLRKRSEPL